MKRIVPFILLAAVFMVALPRSSLGDEISPRPKLPPEIIQKRTEKSEKTKTARRLMTQRQYQSAADLLESLYEEDPDDPVVRNLLRSCYLNLEQYPKLELLARRAVEKNPRDFTNWVLLAEALSEQGKADAATDAYERAMALGSVFDIERYRILVRSMRTHGLNDEAMRLIDSARTITGDARLFALERGQVLESEREYALAAREYLPILQQDTTHEAAEAERRLLDLLSFAESSQQVENVLLYAGDKLSGQRAVRLLATYYLKNGMLDKAFTFSLRQDSIEGGHGAPLLRYLRECKERKLWSPLIKMSEYLLSRPTPIPMLAQVRMFYGEALTATGRYEEALTSYREALVHAPTSLDSGDVLYAMGALYLDHLHDYDAALQQFKQVTRFHRRGVGYIRSLVAIPKCYLRSGDLSLAHEAYRVLANRSASDNVQEEAAYYLSLISFFEKQYDTAAAGFRRLVVEHPRGFYVNDALQLIMLMSQAGGDTAALSDYAMALYFRTRQKPDSARWYLSRAATAGSRELGDWSLLLLADIDLATADTTAALTSLERLITEFADSYYFPYAMKRKADILMSLQEKSAEALDIYRQLLEAYPDYPFVTEVRKKLRAADSTQNIG